MGGVPPLGYRVEDRKLVIIDSEAEIVRSIFRRSPRAREADPLRRGRSSQLLYLGSRKRPPLKRLDPQCRGCQPPSKAAWWIVVNGRPFEVIGWMTC